MTDDAKPARKNKNRSANRAAIQLLAETYPNAFGAEAVKPLKIGIQEDLVADGKVPASKIKRALASWVRSAHYFKSMQADADRVDIHGEPAGKVTEEEAMHAKTMLKKLRDQRRERDQQERAEARKQRQEVRQKREDMRQKRFSDKLAQLVNKPSNA